MFKAVIAAAAMAALSQTATAQVWSFSCITDVCFDDGTLLGIGSVTTAGFSADSNPPPQPSGVNPGETPAIPVNLKPGRSFADVGNDLISGQLRVGLHVQGFANGGSESFVNLASPVPELPTSLAMLAAVGLLAGTRVLRRSQR